MAVYTEVSPDDLARWLADRRAGLGAVRALTPIAQGIENTNYFVDADTGRYVLTLLERTAPDAIDFPIALMKHLATHGIRCPEPQVGADGRLWAPLNGKPATLATRLPGRQVDQPGPEHCAALGRLLARMHEAAASFAGPVPPNPRGLAWWPLAAGDVAPGLALATARMLVDEIATQHAFATSPAGRSLPRSAVHADLFRDNALFDKDGEPGIIDFYFACEESWLFDLAVTINDWCAAAPGQASVYEPRRLAALLGGYVTVRPLRPVEVDALPTLLRAAALRFWLSRLHDRALPRDASLLAAKDPEPFEHLLRRLRDDVATRNILSSLPPMAQ